MKRFITFVPLQPPDKLVACRYTAAGNQALAYDRETRFPIIPVLHGYTQPGDRIQVIAVVSDYPNALANVQTLQQEIQALCNERQLDCSGVETIRVPYDDALSTHLETFRQLIRYIRDDDSLYACITYGSKPSAMVELMALRYARRLCRNVDVGCVVYGKMDHTSGQGRLYDTTALVLLDDIMNVLAGAGVKDPLSSLQELTQL